MVTAAVQDVRLVTACNLHAARAHERILENAQQLPSLSPILDQVMNVVNIAKGSDMGRGKALLNAS